VRPVTGRHERWRQPAAGGRSEVVMGQRLSYRPAEVRTLIGLGRTKVGELLSTGEIESFVVGRARLVPRAAIQRWLSHRTQRARSAESRCVSPHDPSSGREG
jgi:excisionase family DNA binding protein